MQKVKQFWNQYFPFILALIPVLLLRDFTPNNELRYIAVAVEALKEHHWVAFTLQGEPYTEFPPLYFWLLMLSKVIFRHWYMIQLGIFSLLPALMIVEVMHRWVCRYEMGGLRLSDGSQSRDLAQWMLFTSGMMFFMSFYLRMDMLNTLWVVLALYNFWQILYEPLGANEEHGVKPRERHTIRYQFRFGAMLLLSFLTKGHWGPCIIFVTTTLYLLTSGRAKSWIRVWGWRTWLILLGGIGLWLQALWLEGGGIYFEHMTLDRLYQPLMDSLFHHSRPWFYYLGSMLIISIPWGPICMVMLVASMVRRWRNTTETNWLRKFSLPTPLQNFFAMVYLVTLVGLSCIPGKIDVRLLPVFPFLIYVGVMQMGQWHWPLKWQWRMLWVCRIILIGIFIAGCFVPTFNSEMGCYGHLCWKARQISRDLQTEGYYTYQLQSMSNMDVYLHEDPKEAHMADFVQHNLQNSLLLIDEKEYQGLQLRLSHLRVSKEWRGTIVGRKGPYVIVLFPKETDPKGEGKLRVKS